MAKKTKRLYDRMKYGIGEKSNKAATLAAKAEALEKEEEGKGKGKGKGKQAAAAAAAASGPASKKARKK